MKNLILTLALLATFAAFGAEIDPIKWRPTIPTKEELKTWPREKVENVLLRSLKLLNTQCERIELMNTMLEEREATINLLKQQLQKQIVHSTNSLHQLTLKHTAILNKTCDESDAVIKDGFAKANRVLEKLIKENAALKEENARLKGQKVINTTP